MPSIIWFDIQQQQQQRSFGWRAVWAAVGLRTAICLRAIAQSSSLLYLTANVAQSSDTCSPASAAAKVGQVDLAGRVRESSSRREFESSSRVDATGDGGESGGRVTGGGPTRLRGIGIYIGIAYYRYTLYMYAYRHGMRAVAIVVRLLRWLSVPSPCDFQCCECACVPVGTGTVICVDV